MFKNLMQKLVSWLDPKLDRFRAHPFTTIKSQPQKPVNPPKYTPQNLKDFIDVIRRTPHNILSSTDRARISAVMSFDDHTVSDLMIPKTDMVFVKTTDVLGPLVLDKLYKSGFTNFPVIDSKEKVKGVIHTEALNALEIKTTDRASKYLDPNFNYLHVSDSLPHAVEEINRTNSHYFLVLDKTDSLAGFFTVDILLDYLLGQDNKLNSQ